MKGSWGSRNSESLGVQEGSINLLGDPEFEVTESHCSGVVPLWSLGIEIELRCCFLFKRFSLWTDCVPDTQVRNRGQV